MKRKPLPLIRDCQDCGQCCEGQEALPVSWYLGNVNVFRPGDPATLPPDLRAELEAMLADFMANGFPVGTACVWFDVEKKQCKHYEHRPELCRTEIVPGDESCRLIRMKAGMDGAKKFTIKNGKVVSAK
jgi:Fe-S-cluster containining protein